MIKDFGLYLKRWNIFKLNKEQNDDLNVKNIKIDKNIFMNIYFFCNAEERKKLLMLNINLLTFILNSIDFKKEMIQIMQKKISFNKYFN